VLLVLVAKGGCRNADEAEAARLCRVAEGVEKDNPRAALELKRRIWEQMPTAGTVAAADCLRSVREKMGRVRVLVVEDASGATDAVDGCAWAVMAMEVFKGSSNPPFRRHWGRRLMERCIHVVGRAWTRDPDNPRYRELNERLKVLSDQ
jgi:hypothetical protein